MRFGDLTFAFGKGLIRVHSYESLSFVPCKKDAKKREMLNTLRKGYRHVTIKTHVTFLRSQVQPDLVAGDDFPVARRPLHLRPQRGRERGQRQPGGRAVGHG